MTTQNENNYYVPPKVWEYEGKTSGTKWSLNRPTAGSRFDKELPIGKHPIQLYSLGTPNGQKVTMMLEELLDTGCKEAEYDAWIIDIEKGDQFGSGFTNLNPNSKIPAMIVKNDPKAGNGDGPLKIFESGSILLYLADRFKKFIPQDNISKRIETLNWLFWQMGSGPFVGGGFGHFYTYAHEKQKYPIDRYAMEVKRQLDVLNRQLSVNKFLVGDELTIADLACFPWYGNLVLGRLYGGSAEFLSVHEYPNVMRWANEINQRPAIQRGRKVNRIWGKPSEQLRERHDARDFGKLPNPENDDNDKKDEGADGDKNKKEAEEEETHPSMNKKPRKD